MRPAMTKEVSKPEPSQELVPGYADSDELTDEAGGARRFCEALQHEGVLCKETHDNVIRMAPPLVISRDEIDWTVERLDKVMTML